MNQKQIGIVVLVALLVGAASFYGGMAYGKSVATKNTAVFGAGARGQFAGNARRGGAAGGGFVTGQIISKDAQSLTVQMQDGTGSKIVLFSPSTAVGMMTTGTIDSLVVGDRVMIGGTTNTDGSVTAQTIQIRPNMPNQAGAVNGTMMRQQP